MILISQWIIMSCMGCLVQLEMLLVPDLCIHGSTNTSCASFLHFSLYHQHHPCIIPTYRPLQTNFLHVSCPPLSTLLDIIPTLETGKFSGLNSNHDGVVCGSGTLMRVSMVTYPVSFRVKKKSFFAFPLILSLNDHLPTSIHPDH